MRVDEALRRALLPEHGNVNGRAPAFRFLAPRDVLIMERVRAADVGHRTDVDEGLQKLLAAATKRDAQKIASAIVITGQALFDLIENCGSIGFIHAEGHRRDMPEGRALTSDERIRLLSSGVRDPKVLGKIRDGYREQRYLSWHSFTSTADPARWHCIFYELRDIVGDPLTGKPQSEEIGPHVHYSSHLFHRVSCGEFVQMMKPGAKGAAPRSRQVPDQLRGRGSPRS